MLSVVMLSVVAPWIRHLSAESVEDLDEFGLGDDAVAVAVEKVEGLTNLFHFSDLQEKTCPGPNVIKLFTAVNYGFS
jgi:hypothetical protein